MHSFPKGSNWIDSAACIAFFVFVVVSGFFPPLIHTRTSWEPGGTWAWNKAVVKRPVSASAERVRKSASTILVEMQFFCSRLNRLIRSLNSSFHVGYFGCLISTWNFRWQSGFYGTMGQISTNIPHNNWKIPKHQGRLQQEFASACSQKPQQVRLWRRGRRRHAPQFLSKKAEGISYFVLVHLLCLAVLGIHSWCVQQDGALTSRTLGWYHFALSRS